MSEVVLTEVPVLATQAHRETYNDGSWIEFRVRVLDNGEERIERRVGQGDDAKPWQVHELPVRTRALLAAARDTVLGQEPRGALAPDTPAPSLARQCPRCRYMWFRDACDVERA
jgi:hypothetical protein